MNNQKENPASVDALNRISEVFRLRNACIYLVAHDLAESNASAPLTVASIQRDLVQALDPRAHAGRTNGPQLLAELVDAGLLSETDAAGLRRVATLVAKECSPDVDPLLEVARRVLALRLAAGGRRG